MIGELVVATHNEKKGRELRQLLEGRGVVIRTLGEMGVTREPEETGATFRENARIKAEAAVRATGLPALADDSGLCVEVLGGAPGVLSARFGGFSSDRERNDHLLRLMESQTNRSCFFHCSALLLWPDGRLLTADGRCDGLLLDAPRGEGGFGYDPLFLLPGLGKTMAQLSAGEKNFLSHRGQALRALCARLGAAR